jgi:SAM-dependent methyltransferase
MSAPGRRVRKAIAGALPRPLKRLLRRFVPSRPGRVARPALADEGGSVISYIPRDHARQVHPRHYLDEAMSAPDAPALVVDLGCGAGASAAHFRRWKPDVEWIGVDLEESELARAIEGEQVILYDGVNLPFADDSVPLIYSNQVFEHVRHPDALLSEIRRVLTPGGVFIGSTSQMEPYHAESIWGGYTLHGWQTLCAGAGLVLEEVRPGIDSIALINRQYDRRDLGPPERSPWESSPLNEEIDRWAAEREASAYATNVRKLQFCGQFAFRVRKPAANT